MGGIQQNAASQFSFGSLSHNVLAVIGDIDRLEIIFGDVLIAWRVVASLFFAVVVVRFAPATANQNINAGQRVSAMTDRRSAD